MGPTDSYLRLKFLATQKIFLVDRKKFWGGYSRGWAFKIRHFRGFIGDVGKKGIFLVKVVCITILG